MHQQVSFEGLKAGRGEEVFKMTNIFPMSRSYVPLISQLLFKMYVDLKSNAKIHIMLLAWQGHLYTLYIQ